MLTCFFKEILGAAAGFSSAASAVAMERRDERGKENKLKKTRFVRIKENQQIVEGMDIGWRIEGLK